MIMGIEKKYIVVLFVRSLSKGGAEKQAILLYNYLSEFYCTYLVVYDNSFKEAHETNITENIIFLNGNFINKLFQFYNFLKKNKVTHIFNYLPVNNIIGIVSGKLAGVKFLYGGIRGVEYKSRLKMILMKQLCNNIADYFISNSYSAKENYSKYGFNKRKIIVIHNAIDDNKITKITHKKINTFNSKVKILSVGRFTEQKDFDTAINSINYLIQEYPAIREQIYYKIIGYGNLETFIFKKIKDFQLMDICEIITDGIIGDSYINSDIFLSTSIYEGMPNVIMEAMNYGLPIVATDAGDTKFLVKDNFNGFLCSVGDFESIAEKIYLLLNDHKLRESMGQKSKKIIDENYRPSQIFKAYRKLIEDGKKK